MITSWNVNSIRARLALLLEYINNHTPSILLLQEIKCTDNTFPYALLEDLGYNIVICGEKSYNGVAVLSKYPIYDVETTMIGADNAARYISGSITINGIFTRVASIYVPQGTELGSSRFDYELRFYSILVQQFAKEIRYSDIFIAGGDYNVAIDARDVYAPLDGVLGFNSLERSAMKELVNSGFFDAYRELNPYTQKYSWWDYRGDGWKYNKGMRLDYILTSAKALDITSDAGIHTEYRGMPAASDHAPVFIKIKA